MLLLPEAYVAQWSTAPVSSNSVGAPVTITGCVNSTVSGITAPAAYVAFAADEVTLKYVNARNVSGKKFECLQSDPDAKYYSVRNYRAEDIVPCVALAHSPDNYAAAKDCGDRKIDRAYIGSCTGGKISDFVMAATILNGRKVAVPTFLVPATVEVAAAFDTEMIAGKTLNQIFKEAGCLPPAPPSCAACLGGPADTFGRTTGNEVCISTTNRNFIGRMGSKSAQVILASPYTVAASAVTGRITDPREFL